MTDLTWKPHLRLRNTGRSQAYVNPATGGGSTSRPPDYPQRNRAVHGQKLAAELLGLEQREPKLKQLREAAGVEADGTTMAIDIDINKDFAPESLEDRRGNRHIELLSLRAEANGKGVATVFVPNGRMTSPKRKVEAYLDPSKDSASGAARGKAAIQSVDTYRVPTAIDSWTDPVYPFPSKRGTYRWEVWIRGGDIDAFRRNAAALNITLSGQDLAFPARHVVVARATIAEMERAVSLLDSIAELRAAPRFDVDFHSMDTVEKAEWTHELADRLVAPADDSVALCLLDSGVAWTHALLKTAISEADCHAAGPWSPADIMGHGTEMAGIACFGEWLGDALESGDPVQVPFSLESVKVIEAGTKHAPLEVRGKLLRDAPRQPEDKTPDRKRVFTLTVTGDRSPEGRPTCWSGALDQVCFGVDGESQRLVFVSAGNHVPVEGYAYPEDNLSDTVQDPAQAWNALTVGAISSRDDVNLKMRPGWTVIGGVGDVSPHTTTSRFWDTKTWPNKPDMVMEGGNMAAPPGGKPQRVEELELLTTHLPGIARPLLTSAGGTSPAAVLAGRYATRIRQEYPNLWPETVRALLIHSCRWTKTMMDRCQEGTRRQRYSDLLRTFGYGSPDLQRALHSAGHALTLVIEDTMQPYKLDGTKPKDNELRVHTLPWPDSALEALGETEVRLRVTLSYFVEPGPGERGWGDRYRYPSHALRFAVKTFEETDLAFQKRISKAARAEGETGFPSDASEWDIGKDARDRGSVHSDVWRGPASKLTGRGSIAVFPVIGWWRKRPHLGQVECEARYTLAASLETDDLEVNVEGAAVEVDFYTEVKNQIGIVVET